MTENSETARKPYDPAWLHGFETRDGRTAVLLGKRSNGELVWDTQIRVYVTDPAGECTGIFHSVRSFDIFCTPAPVERPLECWVNVWKRSGIGKPHLDREECESVVARRVEGCDEFERTVVHLREVASEPNGGALEFGLRTDLGQSEGGTLGAEPDYRVDRGCGLPLEPSGKEPGGLSAEQVDWLVAYFEQMSINCGPGQCGDMMNEAARCVRDLAQDDEL